VTEVVRLTFVSHAMTDAMAGGRFATDEPLNATGRRQVDASIDLGIRSRSCPEIGCGVREQLSGVVAEFGDRLRVLHRWAGVSGKTGWSWRTWEWCATGR
jgi:hypothetical protein